MVLDESSVLPARAALDSNEERSRMSCVSCMVIPVENRPQKNSTDPNIWHVRRIGVHCGKGEASAYCRLCHHYFHSTPRHLPDGKDKLIAFLTGKRGRDGDPLYGPMVENNCFHHSILSPLL